MAWDFRVQVFEKGDELSLAFAVKRLSIHFAAARVEGSKELKRSSAFILLFDKIGHILLPCRLGRSQTWPRLERCLLIDVKDNLMRFQGASVQMNDVLHTLVEVRIPRPFWAHPHMAAPRLQFVRRQDPLGGLGRDAFGDTICHQLSGNIRTEPSGQRATDGIRTLAGDLDDMRRYF